MMPNNGVASEDAWWGSGDTGESHAMLKKEQWTVTEDAILKDYMEKLGEGSFSGCSAGLPPISFSLLPSIPLIFSPALISGPVAVVVYGRPALRLLLPSLCPPSP
ncbi:hypothetical protein HHK36_023157 [Tetracentron sinense]|uniref:Uncharacterized protein n=1 Tax=Tetracentron sinense TaxID=13715 RepID=A0A835D500_TETSI|nr:hypothetical protein HHK36_023157 [Tetracentron sinense]